MPLLPVRVLPLKESSVGPFLIRVDMDESSAAIYVRRQSDKKTWACLVRSLQDILAPAQAQQTRALDLSAVVTCLYNGVAHDASALHADNIDLFRREVSFAQPADPSGSVARLTARIVVRSTTTVDVAEDDAVESKDEEIVFHFDFMPADANIERVSADFSSTERHAVSLALVGTAFPLNFLNWLPSADRDLVYPVRDGVYLRLDSFMEFTVRIVHPKGPVLFVVSLGVDALKPDEFVTYQPHPKRNVYHTIAQYSVQAKAKSILQVALLHGSACALEGTTLAIREQGHAPKKTQL